MLQLLQIMGQHATAVLADVEEQYNAVVHVLVLIQLLEIMEQHATATCAGNVEEQYNAVDSAAARHQHLVRALLDKSNAPETLYNHAPQAARGAILTALQTMDGIAAETQKNSGLTDAAAELALTLLRHKLTAPQLHQQTQTD